jgi:hypothetical protein
VNKAGTLAIIGGVSGIVGGLFLVFWIRLWSIFGAESSLESHGVATVIFASIGLTCGFIENKKYMAYTGVVMILMGAGTILFSGLLGVLTFICFLIGGLILMNEWKKHLMEDAIAETKGEN